MIVQCPSCSKRYRVNDDNIPASGGKIRCPACSHSFVVYPDTGGDQGGEVHEPGEKTQVAKRPNMEELLKGMQNQGGGAGADADAGGGGGEPEADKTEVMSGSELPDFGNLFGGGGEAGPDATTEMSNPLGSPGDSLPGMTPDPAEDDRATQEIDANIARESLNQVQEIAESSAPVTGPGGGDDDETQIASPPPDLGEIPRPGQQQRASVPDDPTPPPGHSPSGAGSVGGGQQSGPDPDHDGPWKLRTSFGLTYEFTDNDSLRDWMAKKNEREELEGFDLSADGEAFFPLTEFPQFKQALAGGSGAHRPSPGSGARRPSSPGSVPGSGPMGAPPSPGAAGQNPSSPGVSGGPASQPGGRTGSSAGGSAAPMPPSGGGHSPFQTAASPAVGPGDKPEQPAAAKEKINPDEKFQPPSRDGNLLNWMLWGAFGLLFVAAVILALQLGGVISLGGEEEEEVAQEEALPEGIPEEAIDEDDDSGGISERARSEAQRLMESAESDMESNRLASALDRLERASELDPTRFQLFEMQAEVHEQLGEEEQAQQLREHANELRGESEGVAPPPLPDDDEEG